MHRQPNSRDQPAAAGRHQYVVDGQPQGLGLSHGLESESALAGDDIRVVVSRNDHAAGADPPGDLLAVFFYPVVGDDFRAVGAGIGEFNGRRVLRHDDGGLEAEDFRRRRHALRVIAGGERHHTGALSVRG